MFLESSHTLSPFLNGLKVDFRRSAMRVLASSCAASASSRYLIKIFILSSTAGYFVFSNDNVRVIGDSVRGHSASSDVSSDNTPSTLYIPPHRC